MTSTKYIGLDVHKEHADYPIMPTTNRKQRSEELAMAF